MDFIKTKRLRIVVNPVQIRYTSTIPEPFLTTKDGKLQGGLRQEKAGLCNTANRQNGKRKGNESYERRRICAD